VGGVAGSIGGAVVGKGIGDVTSIGLDKKVDKL